MDREMNRWTFGYMYGYMKIMQQLKSLAVSVADLMPCAESCKRVTVAVLICYMGHQGLFG